MTPGRWHAPQSILLLVLGVAVVGTVAVGLILDGTPQAATAESVATDAALAADGSPTPDSAVSAPELIPSADRGPLGALDSSGRALRQRTLLLMVRDEQGLVTNAVLLATSDPSHPAAALMIPPGLLVPTPTWTTLARTGASTDTLRPSNAVSALLGVRIDGSLILDRLALAAIVDAIGGVPAQVDRPLMVVKSGQLVVNIPAGSRVLDGLEACDYAMALPTPIAEPDRISRFTSVLRSILRDLPEEPEELGQLVLSLGSLARSTQTNERSVSILRDLSRDSRAGDMDYGLLPTVAVRGAGPVQVDLDRAKEIVLSSMPDAVLQPGQSPGIRVILAAAGASPGQVAMALARLEADGRAVIEAGAAPLPQATTAVMIPDNSPQARAMGVEVAAALGLPEGAVRIEPGVRASPDVVVWLGRDAQTLASGSAPAM